MLHVQQVLGKLTSAKSARINSRLLSQYKGHTVRLTAKVLKLVGDTAPVQASDGGEVRHCFPSRWGSDYFLAGRKLR